jgi:hypothetical protein
MEILILKIVFFLAQTQLITATRQLDYVRQHVLQLLILEV